MIFVETVEYALYKGEALLAIGTLEEIAAERGVKPRTIYNYSMPGHIARMEERKAPISHKWHAKRVKRGVYKVFDDNSLIGEGNLKQLVQQTGIDAEKLKNLFYGEPPKIRKKNYQVAVRLEE